MAPRPPTLGRAPAEPCRASGSRRLGRRTAGGFALPLRPGGAVSRLGIAPGESSDHRRKATGGDACGDVVELRALDTPKADAITGLQQNRLRRAGIVETHGRASEQPEAAGTVHAVDAALDAADGHGAAGHLHAR